MNENVLVNIPLHSGKALLDSTNGSCKTNKCGRDWLRTQSTRNYWKGKDEVKNACEMTFLKHFCRFLFIVVLI